MSSGVKASAIEPVPSPATGEQQEPQGCPAAPQWHAPCEQRTSPPGTISARLEQQRGPHGREGWFSQTWPVSPHVTQSSGGTSQVGGGSLVSQMHSRIGSKQKVQTLVNATSPRSA